MFHRIKAEKPEVVQKIIPVFGDIVSKNLGLNNDHLEKVLNETQIVFHMAATLKLEATLKPSVEMNLIGTQHVVELAKQMPNLISILHLSTAFCNCDVEVLMEKVYDWPQKPKDIISCAEWMKEETMAIMGEKLIAPQPNTYTFTKRLAEILVRDEFPTLPICIVRPSIVMPAFKEPLPGLKKLNKKTFRTYQTMCIKKSSNILRFLSKI
jgi:fatty acyl-CoA reductase